jgi:hypothetical protein
MMATQLRISKGKWRQRVGWTGSAKRVENSVCNGTAHNPVDVDVSRRDISPPPFFFSIEKVISCLSIRYDSTAVFLCL